LFVSDVYFEELLPPIQDKERMDKKNGVSVWEATVDRIIDGDTIVVSPGDKRIRLWGIDTPELKQIHGKEAKKALDLLLPLGSKVKVFQVGIGKFGRALGILETHNKKNVQKELLSGGHAWYYHKTSGFGDTEKLRKQSHRFMDSYKKLEKVAKEKKRGLWKQEDPQSPWEYRKMKIEGRKKVNSRVLGFQYRKKLERTQSRIKPRYYKLSRATESIELERAEESRRMDSANKEIHIEVGDLCQVLFDPKTSDPISISSNCHNAKYFVSRLATPLEMDRYFSRGVNSYSLLAKDCKPEHGIFEEHNALSKVLRSGKCPYKEGIEIECIDQDEDAMDISDEEIGSEEEDEEPPEYKEIFIKAGDTIKGDIFADDTIYPKKTDVQAEIKSSHWNIGDKMLENLGNGMFRISRKVVVPTRKVYRPIEAHAGGSGGRGGGSRRGRGRRRRGSRRARRGIQRFPRVSAFRPVRRRRRFPVSRRRNIWFPPLYIPPVGIYGNNMDTWLYSNYPDHYISGWRYDYQRGVWYRPQWASFL
jgi:endonuclease YncB( thermonuclease family)